MPRVVLERDRVSGQGIAINGIRQGLLVTVGEGEWSDRLSALEARLSESSAFFRGGRIVLNVGDREVEEAQIGEARLAVARHHVQLWALVGENPKTQALAREAGLVTELTLPSESESEGSAEETEGPSAQAIVVRRTLRSGQSLRHPGHIVIVGDVNPGAEVEAAGDIVVWGRARGLVHAGALGDEKAMICALDLAPTQLRIGNHVARSPEERPSEPAPERASIREGQIVAVPWPS
jgi:septum site-determining protein MinC